MRAGRLRHVIVIQKVTETRSDTGAIVESWGTFLTTRAAIEPIKGNEPFASAHLRGETTVSITLRFHPGITSKMRITSGGLTYEIDSPPINPKSTDRMQILLCSVIET